MEKNLNLLIERYPILKECENNIYQAFCMIRDSYENGGKMLIAGNGGSAADSDHIVGELMKGFKKKRYLNEQLRDSLLNTNREYGSILSERLQGALPTMALSNHNSLNTAFHNDVDGDLLFAQQVNGYGTEGDVFLAISTSGNSKNILYALTIAKAKGLKTVGLTGATGGKMRELLDVCISVPCEETYMIQELHLPIYHCMCLMLESYFWKE